MTAGTSESLFFHLAVLLVSIFIWGLLLRFLKVKSLALAFMLGYTTLAAYAVFKGWRPLEAGGFNEKASEAVTFSYPAVLLAKYLQQKFYFVILIAALFQYCAAGWIVEMIAGSIAGDAGK